MTRIRLAVALFAVLALPAAAHAAATGFDVEAATRAWLDTLQGPARAKSDAYFEGGYWLPLWGALLSIVIDLLLLRRRLSARFRDWGQNLSGRPWIVTGVTAFCYGVVGTVLMFPWSVYTDFLREEQYGLMNQSFGGWLGEQAIGIAIGMVASTVLFIAIYAAIRRFPKGWWILGSGIMAAFVTVAILIAPVYITPLFNTYTELPDGPVRDRILSMANSNNVPASHVYVFDASKQTKRISANVSGLGPTVRISLNDNLLNRSSEQEIAAVMGHELGHYVLGHTLRNMLFMVGLSALALFLLSRAVPWLIARHGRRWGVKDIADPASLPVLSICLAIVGLLATPLTNTLIRVDESEADVFGLDVAREPDAFASVAMKLSEYRKIEPGWLEEALFYDHPSGATRVRMAMAWKKAHVPNAQVVHPAPMPQDFGGQ